MSVFLFTEHDGLCDNRQDELNVLISSCTSPVLRHCVKELLQVDVNNPHASVVEILQ